MSTTDSCLSLTNESFASAPGWGGAEIGAMAGAIIEVALEAVAVSAGAAATARAAVATGTLLGAATGAAALLTSAKTGSYRKVSYVQMSMQYRDTNTLLECQTQHLNLIEPILHHQLQSHHHYHPCAAHHIY